MSNPAFKLILCDLGNVLINFDHRIAVRRILKFTDAKFDEVYQLFFDSGFTKDFEEGKITPLGFYESVRQKLQLKNLSFDAFSSIWNDIFFDNFGMVDFLKCLKKNYSLHLISNINQMHYEYILKKFPQIFDIFDKVYLSYVLRYRKPAKEIYRQAVEEAGFRFPETLYVDDRIDLIEEAKKLGIFGIIFKNMPDLKNKLIELKLCI